MTNEEQNEKVLSIQQAMLSLSKERTQMAATRSYMNAERTLSVWVRTSLAAMIFGIATDRLGLMTKGLSSHPSTFFKHLNTPTTIIGAALVIFSVIMALSACLRFIAYTKQYKKEYTPPAHHRTWLPVTYAFMVVFFGIALIVLMWWLR